MPEAARFWSWRRWLPDVGAAFSRFPPAVLLAGFLTLFKLSTSNPSEIEDRILGTLAASFLWVLAVDLFVESHRRSQRTQVIAWLAGTAIALLFRFQWEVWFLALLLFGALILGSWSLRSSRRKGTQRVLLAAQHTGSGLPSLWCCLAHACSAAASPSFSRR